MLGLTNSRVEYLRSYFSKQKVLLGVWALMAVLATAKQLLKGNYNNYHIFKQTFWHALHELKLYELYPAEYFDKNHYGPFFSLLIAPFALLPDFMGALLWQLANTFFLFWAITRLPLKNAQKVAIYWLVAHEALTAMFSFQINAGITAMIILSLCFIREKKDFWAACMIMLGTFIKIYGIVGLAFFFFSRRKPTFILSCVFWAVVFFLLPMLVFKPQFVVQSYIDWFWVLQEKNLSNTVSTMQDICVMGMSRRIFQDPTLPNLPFIAVGLVLFLLPYLRVHLYRNAVFQMLLLASVLLFLVLFSSGSESPTYVIAFTGVALWFALQPKPVKPLYLGLLVVALIITSMSPSDLFPAYIREQVIRPYSLKALPCLLVWLAVTYDLLTNKFASETTLSPAKASEERVQEQLMTS